MITKRCARCDEPFTHGTGRGQARKYCSERCSIQQGHENFVSSAVDTCSVGGCDSIAIRKTAGLCEAHYMRHRRTGQFDKLIRAPRVPGSHGYMPITVRGHPMCDHRGSGYEHRVFLYDAIGPGPHSCRWCGIPVNWKEKGKAKLVVDHINGVKADNRLVNLVPSCHRCNATRGLFQHWVILHQDDPFLWELYEKFKSGSS